MLHLLNLPADAQQVLDADEEVLLVHLAAL